MYPPVLTDVLLEFFVGMLGATDGELNVPILKRIGLLVYDKDTGALTQHAPSRTPALHPTHPAQPPPTLHRFLIVKDVPATSASVSPMDLRLATFKFHAGASGTNHKTSCPEYERSSTLRRYPPKWKNGASHSHRPSLLSAAIALAQFQAMKRDATNPRHLQRLPHVEPLLRNPHLYTKLVDFSANVDKRTTNFPPDIRNLEDLQPEWFSDRIALQNVEVGIHAPAPSMPVLSR
ncbi:hypothetical protein D9615_009401 [Tricholomella constricta]|uniref:Uncharacterized protein n=1 Tax=Tricholomella constricta TaxID=117010 RepID=A0A8H5M036_9AGAR|nr:hypothetical protein D9615_009401 [Tricholomella constricta]